MATANPNPSSGGGRNAPPYTNPTIPTQGPRDLRGNLKGGKGPYGGAGPGEAPTRPKP
jgi:hypothetical protein